MPITTFLACDPSYIRTTIDKSIIGRTLHAAAFSTRCQQATHYATRQRGLTDEDILARIDADYRAHGGPDAGPATVLLFPDGDRSVAGGPAPPRPW